MINRGRVLRLLVVILFFSAGICVQAQDYLFKHITQQLDQYNQLYSKEKIYLRSDKNFYLAGEIIWFKIYYVDGASHKPATMSKVVYAELLDRNNKSVLQAKLSLSTDGASGSFYLPLTISSDNYTLRAYTNWMKNAGSQVFFEKKISVVNTIRASAAKPAEAPPQAEAVFFPEGGHLVSGIETKIGFHITDKTGRGIDAKGMIIDNAGDTIAQFSTARFGMGHFRLKPEAGKEYNAIVVLPGGQSIRRSLPSVQSSGYVMNIVDDNDGRLKVTVKAKALMAGQGGEELFLLAHCRQVAAFSAQQYITYGNEILFTVDKSKLGDGVNHFTLFNRAQQPVCERLVFKRPASQVTAQLATNDQFYTFRQPVDLSVIVNSMTDTSWANCSVSVYQADSLQDREDLTISNYLLLISDLRGNVESPAYYFSGDSGVDEAADNLMLTHGWRRFKWENLLGNSTGSLRFKPEYRGHIITGRVVNVTNGNVVANADCYLSVPSSPFGFYIAKSDSTGIVRFDTKDYYGSGELIAQVAEQNKTSYRVDLFSPFADNPSFASLPAMPALSKDRSDVLLQKSIAMQAQNIYRADSIRRYTPPHIPDTIPFYGHPELTYLLDNYKRFTTMEEVLREYVTNINVVLRNGKLHMSVFDDASRQVYQDNALVFLDGVPLFDYNKLFSYDPLKVKKLEVVPRRYLIGPRLFSGVISFETYNGKFDGFELDPALVAVDYEGLQLQREFYSPAYNENNRNNRVPDLRTTLFWAPDLHAGKQNSTTRFYTSDQAGKFLVVLEGITATGQPVHGTTSFTVK